MGPLFNGATISAERSVRAAGDAALNFYNLPMDGAVANGPAKAPQCGPKGEGDDESTSTDGDDTTTDNGGTKPTTDQQTQIDKANEANAPTDTQKVLDEAIKIITSPEVESAEDVLKNLDDLSNNLDQLVKDVEDAEKVIEGLQTLIDLVKDVLTATDGAVAALVQFIGDELLKLLEKALGEELDDLVDKVKKGLVDDLISALQDSLDADYQALKCGPWPATFKGPISHSPVEAHMMEMISIALLGGDVSGMMNLVSKVPEGKINGGSTNVFFEGKRVARLYDPVLCDLHGDQRIAEGSETVFANGWPIARPGHKITCNGVITEGVSSVQIDMTTSSAFKLNINVGTKGRLLDLALVISGKDPIVQSGQNDPCSDQTSPSQPGS